MIQDVHAKLNPGLLSKTAFNKKKTLFTSQTDSDLRRHLYSAEFGTELSMVLKFGHFQNCVRSTWKILKCGAGDGWRRTVWTYRVRNEEVLYRVKKGRNILQTTKGRKANWIGRILRRNCLLKRVVKANV